MTGAYTPIHPWSPEGFRFSPWVGEKYYLGFHGRRFLILGESHYTDWDDGDGRVKHELGTEFTKECVTEVKERTPGSAEFWKYIEQLLLNKRREPYKGDRKSVV